MSLKVDMKEVNNMKKAIATSLGNVDEKVNVLDTSMNNLISTNGFEGKTAQSVKNYTETFHIKTISDIEKINDSFKKDLEKSISKFKESVDNDDNAIIKEDKLRDYKNNISDELKGVFKSIHSANDSISTVSDLTEAKSIKSLELAEKMASFYKQIDLTVQKLVDFDQLSNIDGDITQNQISELKQLSSYVKKLPSNRARISKTTKQIESAIIRHKTSETIIKWQKFLEENSDMAFTLPKIDKRIVEAFKQSVREYFAVKAIGDGSVIRGYKRYLSSNNINALINNMSKKQMREMAVFINVSIDNINIKNVFKNAGEFVKNNPFKKGNLINWLSRVQGYHNQNAKLLRRTLKDKNFQYTFVNSNKFFNIKEMKKAAKTEFANTFFSEEFRKNLFKKENFQSKSAIKKNLKSYWDEGIKGKFLNGFKNKNIIGKLKNLSKLGGKVLKPLGVITAFTDNLNKKTWEEQAAGMGVDLAAVGASAAAGAAIGTAVPLPVVGTLVGAAGGIVADLILNRKVNNGKSVKEIAKVKIEKGLKKAEEGFRKFTTGLQNVFG